MFFLRFILVSAIACVLPATQAFAGAISAEVDRTVTSVNDEPLWLTLTITGSLDGDVSVADTKDFEITRTGESTNISIVNGAVTKERQFTYQVQPLKPGRLSIPSFSAKVDGKAVSTSLISVEVSGQGRPDSKNAGEADKKLVFVERDLPKTTVFEGEAIISVVRLLMRARLTGATPLRDAAPDWRLIPVDGQKNIDLLRDGQRWNAIEMREGLIALRSGKLKAPSFGITATWIQPKERRQPRRPGSVFDLFQQGMFDGGQEITRKLFSEPLDIIVKPLPIPKPKTFADIVGAFRFTANVSNRELAVGDTTTVTLEVKGQGALDRMKDVTLNVPSARIYADKPDIAEKIEPAAGLVSTRTMKYAVVANTPGTIDLGDIKIASFNPFTEQYEELTASLGKISVNDSALPNPNSTAAQSGNSIPIDPPSTAEKPMNDPANVEGKAVDGMLMMDAPARARAWWFAPWVLAIEILCLAVFIGFLLIRYSLPKVKFQTDNIVSVPSDDWASVRQAFLNNSPEALHIMLDSLRRRFARADQDPKTLTSLDILANAKAISFDEMGLQALRQLLSLIDKAEYGGMRDLNLSDEMKAEIFKLIELIEVK